MPPQRKIINTEPAKSVVIIPSRIGKPDEQVEGVEETEIAAQITMPQDGGWGWVVVIASFCCIFVLDGVVFTFGSMLEDLTNDLQIEESIVAILNSLAIAMYFSTGPLTSALINRFGFRAIVMTGGTLVSISLFCTYFATTYFALCIFFGIIPGLGFCFINMGASLIVGFYFEKLRSLAIAIASNGSSIGVMVMYPVNAYLAKTVGWRVVTLLHSGMFGTVYFMGMTYRPLLSLTVTKTTDDPTKTVTYLPSLSTPTSANDIKPAASRIRGTVTEKLFSAVSNTNFPTAAAVVEEGVTVPTVAGPGPSTAGVSKLTLTAHAPKGGISQKQLKQVQSIISKTSEQDKSKRNVELTVKVQQNVGKKRNFIARMFHWEEHVPQSRPMYRDDAFFGGNISTLPAYQKSVMDTPAEAQTGIEYQLAVSRAATTADLEERRGVFTTAARRILATMMDPSLLKRFSFMMFAASGFFTYLGYLVPYVFLPAANRVNGVSEDHITWLVSVIGFANTIGRLLIGALALKIDPLKIFTFVNIGAGVSTILSTLSYNIYFQYSYCIIFGICVSSISSLRSIILVQLYGLEKLTNATGMMLFVQGFGCSLCTPVASAIRAMFGYTITFYSSGAVIILSGIILIPIRTICDKENRRESNLNT